MFRTAAAYAALPYGSYDMLPLNNNRPVALVASPCLVEWFRLYFERVLTKILDHMGLKVYA